LRIRFLSEGRIYGVRYNKISYTLTPCPLENIYQIIQKKRTQNPTSTESDIPTAISDAPCTQ